MPRCARGRSSIPLRAPLSRSACVRWLRPRTPGGFAVYAARPLTHPAFLPRRFRAEFARPVACGRFRTHQAQTLPFAILRGLRGRNSLPSDVRSAHLIHSRARRAAPARPVPPAGFLPCTPLPGIPPPAIVLGRGETLLGGTSPAAFSGSRRPLGCRLPQRRLTNPPDGPRARGPGRAWHGSRSRTCHASPWYFLLGARASRPHKAAGLW